MGNANKIFVWKPYVKRLLWRRAVYLFINDPTRKGTNVSNQLISWSTIHQNGALGSVGVKALCYKPEGRGFDTL
jgi:hypothetical protein